MLMFYIYKKKPNTKSSRDTASPRTYVLQGLFHFEKLSSFFFQSFFCVFFLWFSKHLCPYCPRRKLLVCNSAVFLICLSHMIIVPISKRQIKKYHFSFLHLQSSLSFDAVVWFSLSRGNSLAMSFQSHKGSAQLPQ